MGSRSLTAVLLIVVASIGGGCNSDDAPEPPSLAAAFAALLADGTLVGYSASGEEVARLRVGGELNSPVSGEYIDIMGNARIAVLDAAARPNRLVLVDIKRWAVLRRVQLPRRSVFRNIVVGARTGHFYVAGDRPSDAITPFGSAANAATLAVLDQDGNVIASAVIRSPSNTRGPAAPYDWSVYSIAVDAEEEQIYVSYHGPNTSGADSIAVRGNRLVRCAGSGAGGIGCFQPVHGRLEVFGERILAASGTPPVLVALRPDAAVDARWRSGFDESAHLMEFARVEGRVFGLESCPKLGGLTSINLDQDVARMIAPPAPPGTTRPRGVCGESIAARPRDLHLAIAKTIDDVGFVLIVDATTGRIVAAKPVAAPAVDVAALD